MASMRVSTKGKVELASHEALVVNRYLDSEGIWTVGVGHTSAAGAPDPRQPMDALTVAEVIELFEDDLVRYENDVNRALKVKVSQTQFDALVSWHFNTGAVAKASLIKKLNAGDVAGAAKGFMDWRKPASIIERREKEQRLFRDGVYSNDGKASVYTATVKGAVQWSKGKRVAIASLFTPTAAAKPEITKPAEQPVATPVVIAPVEPYAGITLPRKIPNSKGDPVVFYVQTVLDEKGWHEVGTVDGVMGTRTQGAILMFRNEQEPTLEPLTGTIDQELVNTLEIAPERKVSVTRATTTAADLAKKGDPTVISADTLIKGAMGLGGTAVVGGVDQQGSLDKAKGWLDGFDTAQEIVNRAFGAVQWTLQHWWIPALGAAAFFGYKAWKVRQQRVEDHRTGKNLAL